MWLRSARTRTAATVALNLGLSAALLAGLVLALDAGELVDALAEVEYAWLPLAAGAIVVSDYLRAWRWGVLLRPLAEIPSWSLFRIFMVSLGVNNLLPFRTGDLLRLQLMGSRGISRSSVLATMAGERLFDALTFGLLLVGALGAGYGVAFQALAATYLAIGAAGLLLAFVVIRGFDRGRAPVHALPAIIRRLLPGGARDLAGNFAGGLSALQRPRLLGPATVSSILAWLTAGAGYYFVGRAMDVHAGLIGFLAITVVANTIVALPLTQSSIGPYEIGVTYFLTQIGGVSNEMAAAYAVVMHAVVFVPSIALALPLSWSLHLQPRDIFYLQRRREEAPTP